MEEEYKFDPSIGYDVVELPSKGIHYANGKKSLKVAYLTASDEDILMSPNLIQSNSIVDELVKRKVLDRDISIDDIDEEDKKAILIFLRNTAFGSDYSVTLNDPKTKKDFIYNFDLSSVDYKDFNLVANRDGEYEYYMTKSKFNITFKFLTQKQQKEIDKTTSEWKLETPPPTITKQLEFMIKSVNGNKDQLMIRNFINTLPITDSQEFRKYVNTNKPGIKLEQTAITPSGENIQFSIGLGVEFFRPFYGL